MGLVIIFFIEVPFVWGKIDVTV